MVGFVSGTPPSSSVWPSSRPWLLGGQPAGAAPPASGSGFVASPPGGGPPGKNEQARAVLTELTERVVNLRDLLGGVELLRGCLVPRRVNRAQFAEYHASFLNAFRPYQDRYQPTEGPLHERVRNLINDDEVHRTWRTALESEHRRLLSLVVMMKLLGAFIQDLLLTDPANDASIRKLLQTYFAHPMGSRGHLKSLASSMAVEVRLLIRWIERGPSSSEGGKILQFYRRLYSFLEKKEEGVGSPALSGKVREVRLALQEVFLDAILIPTASLQPPPAVAQALRELVPAGAGFLKGRVTETELTTLLETLETRIRAVRQAMSSSGWGFITENRLRFYFLIEQAHQKPDLQGRLRDHMVTVLVEHVPAFLRILLAGKRGRSSERAKEEVVSLLTRYAGFVKELGEKEIDRIGIGFVEEDLTSLPRPSDGIVPDPTLPPFPLDRLAARAPGYWDAINQLLPWLETGRGGLDEGTIGGILQDLETALKTQAVPESVLENLCSLYDILHHLRRRIREIAKDYEGNPLHPAVPYRIRMEMVGSIKACLAGTAKSTEGLIDRLQSELEAEIGRRTAAGPREASGAETEGPPGWKEESLYPMVVKRLEVTAAYLGNIKRLIALGHFGPYSYDYRRPLEASADFFEKVKDVINKPSLKEVLGPAAERLKRFCGFMCNVGEKAEPALVEDERLRAEAVSLLEELMGDSPNSLSRAITVVADLQRRPARPVGEPGSLLLHLTQFEILVQSRLVPALRGRSLNRGLLDQARQNAEGLVGALDGRLESVEGGGGATAHGLALIALREKVQRFLQESEGILASTRPRAGRLAPIGSDEMRRLEELLAPILFTPFDPSRHLSPLSILQEYYRGGGEERPMRSFRDFLEDLEDCFSILSHWIERWPGERGIVLLKNRIESLQEGNRRVLGHWSDPAVRSCRPGVEMLQEGLSTISACLDDLSALLKEGVAEAEFRERLVPLVERVRLETLSLTARSPFSEEEVGLLSFLKTRLGHFSIVVPRTR